MRLGFSFVRVFRHIFAKNLISLLFCIAMVQKVCKKVELGVDRSIIVAGLFGILSRLNKYSGSLR